MKTVADPGAAPPGAAPLGAALSKLPVDFLLVVERELQLGLLRPILA